MRYVTRLGSRVLFSLILLVCFSLSASAESSLPALKSPANTPLKAAPKKVHLGVYINKIHDLNFENSTYGVVFWLYLTHAHKDDDIIKRVEVVNSKTMTITHQGQSRNPDGSYVSWAEFKGTIFYTFDMKQYPLDQQTLALSVEDNDLDSDHLQFVVSPNQRVNQVMSPEAVGSNWQVLSVDSRVRDYHYDTNFGNVSQGEGSDYSRVTVSVHIERVGLRMFFSLFFVLYLAFLVSLYALVFPNESMFFNSRAQLLSAAIFALVGNRIITDRVMVNAMSFSLVDKMQLLTLVFVALNVVCLRVTGYLRNTRGVKHTYRINTLLALLMLSLYALANYLIFYFR